MRGRGLGRGGLEVSAIGLGCMGTSANHGPPADREGMIHHFTGPAPASMRADADGDFYVAIYGQGRVLVLDRNGIPVGQAPLPGREEGHNLCSTGLALKPGTDDPYIVASDGNGGRGAAIFHAEAFAKALPPLSHQWRAPRTGSPSTRPDPRLSLRETKEEAP